MPDTDTTSSTLGAPAPASPRGLVSGAWVVTARELGSYFDSPIAYIYAAVFIVLSCTTFMNSFFLESVVDMSAYFRVLPYLLIAFVPAITMRTWAEEHAQGTFELIATLPLRSIQLVLGKYVAAFLFYLIVLLGSLPIVAMLVWLGDPDLGLIFSSYLGAILLGGLFLSFGVCLSGMTRNQIVAFVLAAMLGFILVLSGHEAVVEVVDGLAAEWQVGTWLYESISVSPHYEAFARGIIGLGHTLYFVMMGAFFLWMNDIALRRSRF